MIWLTGSQKLVDVRQKDGSTVKKLKVWLTDFGYLPGQTSRAKPECDQNGPTKRRLFLHPQEVMDGDREPPAGISTEHLRGTVSGFQNGLKTWCGPSFVFRQNSTVEGRQKMSNDKGL